MIAIVNQVKTVAEALTAGELFTANVGGGSSAIAYHVGTMPPKPKDSDDPVAPFCLCKATAFEWHPTHRLTVELVYCLYQTDRAEALEDLARLSSLVEPLAVRGTNYPGYKLETVSGWPGEKETGLQTHPYYFLTVAMSFFAPRPRP